MTWIIIKPPRTNGNQFAQVIYSHIVRRTCNKLTFTLFYTLGIYISFTYLHACGC